jgi:hypothetical protein
VLAPYSIRSSTLYSTKPAQLHPTLTTSPIPPLTRPFILSYSILLLQSPSLPSFGFLPTQFCPFFSLTASYFSCNLSCSSRRIMSDHGSYSSHSRSLPYARDFPYSHADDISDSSRWRNARKDAKFLPQNWANVPAPLPVGVPPPLSHSLAYAL